MLLSHQPWSLSDKIQIWIQETYGQVPYRVCTLEIYCKLMSLEVVGGSWDQGLFASACCRVKGTMLSNLWLLNSGNLHYWSYDLWTLWKLIISCFRHICLDWHWSSDSLHLYPISLLHFCLPCLIFVSFILSRYFLDLYITNFQHFIVYSVLQKRLFCDDNGTSCGQSYGKLQLSITSVPEMFHFHFWNSFSLL